MFERHNDSQHNDTQYKTKLKPVYVMLSDRIVSLNIIMQGCSGLAKIENIEANRTYRFE